GSEGVGLRRAAGGPDRQPLPDPGQGLGHPLGGDGLENVVQGPGFEGLDGKIIVGGDEDDPGGPGPFPDLLGQVDARQAGHGDVQKDHVVFQPPDEAQGFPGGDRLTGDLHVVVAAQVIAQLRPGGVFVIDDEGPDNPPPVLHRPAASLRSAARRTGTVMRAKVPRPGRLRRRSPYGSPYRPMSRWLMLAKPSPMPLPTPGVNTPSRRWRGMPTPVSYTTTSSRSWRTRVRTSRRPPPSWGTRPWTTAFSTRGWMVSTGTRQPREAGSMLTLKRKAWPKRAFSISR